MRLFGSLLPLLALSASALDTSQPPTQHIFSTAALPPSPWLPTHVASTVELAGSLTRSSATYQLTKDQHGTGKGDAFVVGVQGGGKAGGWVEAVEGKGMQKKVLPMTAVGGNEDTTYYYIPLSSSETGKTTLTVSAVLSHSSVPVPASLPQNAESIYMLWDGDLLAPLTGFSAEQKAAIEEVKVKVKAPTPRILQAAMVQGEGFTVSHSQGSAMVTFTSKGGIADLPEQIARVHYQQPQAIASIRKLDRIVEISHWGSNLAVQDNIDLANTGPALEGNFARIDYQKATMHRRQNLLAVSSLTIPLPAAAHSPYYYDLVGNVSTSRFRQSPVYSGGAILPSQKKRKNLPPSLLELQPRYPLMGGWNYSFTIGYDVPLDEFVKTRKEGKGHYVAAVPFLTPLKDVAVDEVKVQIRLPEGARNLRVLTPFPMDHLAYPAFTPALWGKAYVPRPGDPEGTVVKTYLDSTGRPAVILEKKGCTDRHGGEVIIEYDLPVLVDYLQKPLAAATVLSSIFLAIILAKRVSWGIA
ncbi:hypothetical protein JCM10213_008216 [Rhodosporidiobolus nylandii]